MLYNIIVSFFAFLKLRIQAQYFIAWVLCMAQNTSQTVKNANKQKWTPLAAMSKFDCQLWLTIG